MMGLLCTQMPTCFANPKGPAVRLALVHPFRQAHNHQHVRLPDLTQQHSSSAASYLAVSQVKPLTQHLPHKMSCVCKSAEPYAAPYTSTTPLSTPSTRPTTSQVFWQSRIGQHPKSLQAALQQATQAALQGCPDPSSVDLALVFVSSAYLDQYDELVAELRKQVPSLRKVLGCTAYGVIGNTSEGPQEVEDEPAISVTLAHIPNAQLRVTQVTASNLPDGDAPPSHWADLLHVPHSTPPSQPLSFIVLSDPMFGQLPELLAGLDYAFPSATKIGGLASAASITRHMGFATFCWDADGDADDSDSVRRRTASVLSMSGGAAMEAMIAQGCRALHPSGRSWSVHSASGSLVRSLADESGRLLTPLDALRADLRPAVSGRNEVEISHMLENLMLAVTSDNLKPASALEPGDYLVRQMVGFDMDGCMRVAELVRPGQRLRFMVRDKLGAQQDLEAHGVAYKRRQLAAALGSGGLGASGTEDSATAGGVSESAAQSANKVSDSASDATHLESDASSTSSSALSDMPCSPEYSTSISSPSSSASHMSDTAPTDSAATSQMSTPPANPPSTTPCQTDTHHEALRAPMTDIHAQQTCTPSSQTADVGTQDVDYASSSQTADPAVHSVSHASQQPFGTLLFTCCGRGVGLYGERSYDARTVASYVPVPAAGFHCNGEIGQVGGATHLHGFTCAVAILKPAPAGPTVQGGSSSSTAAA